jgi:hypothetical protein
MLVKPARGLKIRDPKTNRHLPDEGKDVPENTYWMRRLEVGDVVPVVIDSVEPEVVNQPSQISDFNEGE